MTHHPSLSIILRSTVFNILFFSLTGFLCLVFIVTLILPRRVLIRGVETYERTLELLERYILHLRYEVRGHHHLPKAPYLVAAKHQSAWETMRFHLLIPDAAVVLKRELMLLPLWGWYAAKAGMISVHRNRQGRTIPSLLAGARRVIAQKRPIIIFPQGTRVKPGTHKPYKVGISLLYKELQLPIVPVALNSGVFWPRRSFLKYPGTIVVEFLPLLPPGLPQEDVLPLLQSQLETASDRLAAEAASQHT